MPPKSTQKEAAQSQQGIELPAVASSTGLKVTLKRHASPPVEGKPNLPPLRKSPLDKEASGAGSQRPAIGNHGKGALARPTAGSIRELETLSLAGLEEKRKQLSESLRACEVQIHKLEAQYFETAPTQGNALKGYDGLLSSGKRAKFGPEDRIFSGSSCSGAVGTN